MYAIVILIGGKGTRVSNLLKNKSKPEIEINKKRIIDNLLKQLSYLNKNIIFLSNEKSYLNPEQPPPFTAILKKVPDGFFAGGDVSETTTYTATEEFSRAVTVRTADTT